MGKATETPHLLGMEAALPMLRFLKEEAMFLRQLQAVRRSADDEALPLRVLTPLQHDDDGELSLPITYDRHGAIDDVTAEAQTITGSFRAKTSTPCEWWEPARPPPPPRRSRRGPPSAASVAACRAGTTAASASTRERLVAGDERATGAGFRRFDSTRLSRLILFFFFGREFFLFLRENREKKRKLGNSLILVGFVPIWPLLYRRR